MLHCAASVRALCMTKAVRASLVALHAVWGLPQSIVGLVLACVVRGPRQRFRTAWVTTWRLDAGLSLGLFLFVPRGCPRRLLVHEYGHSVQSLCLGPLYLPVVVVPSLLWAGIPHVERWRVRHGISYYALSTENWANAWGERACGEPSMRGF